MGLFDTIGEIFFDAPQQVGPTQADVTAASQPYGLTAPIGSVTWDEEARTGMAALDPALAATAQRLLGRTEAQAAASAGYDPRTLAREYYQDIVAPDLLEDQQQARLAMENRLLAQGRLGGTGGQRQFGELLEAQEASRRQARGQAFGQAQQYMDTMRQRELADLAAASTLFEAPIGMLTTGAQVGQGLGGILAGYRPTYQANPYMDVAGKVLGGWASTWG